MTPSPDILEPLLSNEVPLHLQVRRVLRSAIEDHFEDGQGFWTEAALIERLGVSRGTVRQALQELSREGLLVRQAAKGSFVRKSAVTTLGVFVPQYDSDFFTGMLEHLASAGRERGWRLHIHYTHRGEGTAEALHHLSQSPSEERIVLLGDFGLPLVQSLQESGYRVVAIDTMLPRYSGRFVGTDNHAVARLGLEHLQALGHQRILLLVNEPAHILSVRQKIEAFRELSTQLELDGRVHDCSAQLWNDSFDVAQAAMPEIWQGHSWRPTAIFTVSDPGAWAALRWLARHEIRVPEEVSVLGFENVRPSRFTHPALTTIAHPMSALAQRACDLLEDDEPHQEYLLPALIERESTARPQNLT